MLKGSKNPFYAQFQDMVATALRSSIQFTNRIKGHSASIPDHAAVEQAIARRQPDKARAAMKKIVGDVLELIDDARTRSQARRESKAQVALAAAARESGERPVRRRIYLEP